MSLDTSGGGGSNAGAPTLTTPTLTPTTLRNIEQMFADRDPHQPPPHHQNAAGFVPPIISPSTGSSYLSLSSVAPTSDVGRAVQLAELPSPSLTDFLPDFTNGRNGSGKPARPGSLSLSSTKTVMLPTSPLPPESPALPALVQKLSSLPPPLVVKTPCPDLTISVRNTEKKERERPPSLQLCPLNGAIINKKMERLDNILKSVATAAVVQVSANIKEEEEEEEEEIEEEEEENEVKPPKTHDGRRLSLPGEVGPPGQETEKRMMRRERNKQAAARCRKRRMDLTCSLQEEVDTWEDRVRSLKEELSDLETQKRGLEAVLRRHSTCCKVVKTD